MNRLYIEGVLIPIGDVKTRSLTVKSTTGYNFKNMTASSIDVELVNIDKNKYDDDYVGSMFYQNWYNMAVELFDLENDRTYFKGRIKSISKSEKSGTITLTVKNFIKDIIDYELRTGFYDMRPSDIIKTILIDHVGLPIEAIDVDSFNDARVIQVEHDIALRLNYSDEKRKKASSVIGEILRMTGSELSSDNNIIQYSAWKNYNGEQGVLIDSSKIIPGSYKTQSNADQIFNKYRILYLNSEGEVPLATAIDSDPDSYAKFGSKQFKVPSENVDESKPASSINIIHTTKDGADYCGALIVDRYKDVLKTCFFDVEIDDETKNLKEGAILDLSYSAYIREPVRIIGKKDSDEKGILQLTCEFVNLSGIYGNNIVRDKVAPESAEIISIVNVGDGSVGIIFKPSISVDVDFYELYFTTTTQFVGEIVDDRFISPMRVVEIVNIGGGLSQFFLPGLSEDIYKFKIAAFDVRKNESESSNIKEKFIYKFNEFGYEFENFYRTVGSFYEGIKPTMNNVLNGVLPDGFIKFDSAIYNSVNYGVSSVYESFVVNRKLPIASILFHAVSDNENDKIYFQYREWINDSFGEWSKSILINGKTNVSVDVKKSIQIRYLFYLVNWKSEVNVNVLNIIEEEM